MKNHKGNSMNWENVSGYFDYSKFYKIALNSVKDDGIIVEIGSWMGRSTSCMGDLIKKSGKKINFFAVDTWEGSNEDAHREELQRLKDQGTTLYDTFLKNIKDCGVENYITPIKSTSLNAAKQFEDNSIDFVHIDASHEYKDVLDDIKAWYPKVKPGGIISGDDYILCWDGVVNAVNEYFEGKNLYIINYDSNGGRVWSHTKPGGNKIMDVTLYAICKNEEKNIENFIEISKKFSDVVVVDTGSTDNSVKLLTEAGIKVYQHPQTREEFDFSKARNQALSYVKTDWAFSLDFNETLSDFFPEGLEVISQEFTTFKHQRFDDDGNGDPKQSNEVHTRFHRTENYTWENAIHEIPKFIPTEKYPEEVSVDTTIKITKKVFESVDKELFYLNICEREYEKDPTNWYYVWFIFNHYFKVKNLEKALEFGQEFLNISKPYFNEFRVDCFIKCSQILLISGNIQSAANYAFHALSEAMNLGGFALEKSFMYLLEIGKVTKNPNIIVFASGFNQNTLSLPERTEAIDKLFLTNLNDIPSTAWNGHRNFAEWIVGHLKPNVIVDLGVDLGYSTFSFAIPRIGKVYGIDNFKGDDFVKQSDNYSYVMMKRDKLHLNDNIEFIKGDFNKVAKTWDKKIDILHIDGSHHYEDVKNDFETWSKFLSDDGVILMHDTCVEDFGNNKYGVKKFFDEINLPKCNFTHCFGLGVVSKNQSLIELIKKTFNI